MGEGCAQLNFSIFMPNNRLPPPGLTPPPGNLVSVTADTVFWNLINIFVVGTLTVIFQVVCAIDNLATCWRCDGVLTS